MRYLLFVPLIACTLTTTKVIQIDRKSTLEQQFIGEYEELSDDLITVASVRAVSTGLGRNGDDPYARALQARRVQAFYKDDLDRARSKGCIGEANEGLVVERPCAETAFMPALPRLVALENDARTALVEYALCKVEVAKEQERKRVWQALRGVMLETLPKGAPVQNNAGLWTGQ